MNEQLPGLFERWESKAFENIDEWGLQDEQTLLLAMQEELGELTQAVLEARAEDGDPERIRDELDDLGALLVQFDEARNVREALSKPEANPHVAPPPSPGTSFEEYGPEDSIETFKRIYDPDE